MLSPEQFREKYPEERLEGELPNSPVGSLRDIQYLYGKLYTLATTGGGEYAPYLTPDAAGDLIDTDESLIVVRVDLSGDEPQLAENERGPVWVTRYSEELVEKIAHCKFAAARGIDHSITHQAGRNSDPGKLARYAKERLTRWATDEVVQKAAENHEDGWLIEALVTLGENETVLGAVEDGVRTALGGEPTTALLTVQVKCEPEEEYQWPGDLDVFLGAMRQRKLSKLVTKNKADDSSGDATDLVTGQATRTVGTSEDPQNYFLGKQREKFPGLDIEEAWRSHPISEDAAVTVMNAGTFVEACTYRTFGTKVYYLPYFFGRLSPEEAYDLYELLHSAATGDGEKTTIERAYEKYRDNETYGTLSNEERTLRFYVSAVMPHQMSRYDVFGETLNGRLLYPRELAREHNRVVDTTAFRTDTEWAAPLPSHENWSLLVGDNERLRSVSTGWYFSQTFAERDDDEADADDPRIEALVAVLSGGSIPVETLLEEYVDRLTVEEDDEDVEGFPSFRVASQFAQLCALAVGGLDLLSTTDPEKEPITREPTYEEPTTQSVTDILATDGGHPAAAKLESFIEDTPALASNDQRRGAFLLGALVGEVGSYQSYSEDRSTTLIDQFPVKSITRSRIKKVTQETIGKTLTYTRDEDRSVTLFEHVVEHLRETILRQDPDEWDLDTDDLRFYYALGVTYGMNDHPDWDRAETDTVTNRSEIVFLYDAVDANPNGNPLSGANRPRVDPQTQQAIVTDVRLKRYLRDQLNDDGHGVYIRNVQEEGEQYTREDLLEDRLKDVDPDDYDLDDEEEAEQLREDVFGEYLDESADVRYFGATMSVDTDDEYEDYLPDHFTGPVQFSPGKSMHAVNENEEYDSLTSVIATQEGKEQGGFDLDDHRIQYGLIRFHGLVDEHGAADTKLTEADIRRLDTLCWRALKNQTISRSKVGQEPRLYCRVEYAEESFHLGGLDRDLALDQSASKPDEELRDVRDLAVETDEFVDRLSNASERIEQVRIVASEVLEFTHNGTSGGPELLYQALREAIGDEIVEVIDIYDEYSETLPADDSA